MLWSRKSPQHLTNAVRAALAAGDGSIAGAVDASADLKDAKSSTVPSVSAKNPTAGVPHRAAGRNRHPDQGRPGELPGRGLQLLDTAQTVRVEMQSADWFTSLGATGMDIDLGPGQVTGVPLPGARGQGLAVRP